MSAPDEQHVNLKVWPRDGVLLTVPMKPRYWPGLKSRRGLPEISVGRAASKRTLGFTVYRGDKELTAFVLDRDQVIALRDHLDYQIRRLKKRGRS